MCAGMHGNVAGWNGGGSLVIPGAEKPGCISPTAGLEEWKGGVSGLACMWRFGGSDSERVGPLPSSVSFSQHCLSEIEVLAIIFAAAIHDYEHTGTTNSFHIQTK